MSVAVHAHEQHGSVPDARRPLPRLSDLLENLNLSKLAAKVGVTRSMAHRWRWGAPVYDDNVIEPLARELHISETLLRAIIRRDREARRRRIST